MLYIADRKMDINNKSDQGEHIVTTYNLNKNPPEKGSATVTYESGRYGGYFKKKT